MTRIWQPHLFTFLAFVGGSKHRRYCTRGSLSRRIMFLLLLYIFSVNKVEKRPTVKAFFSSLLFYLRLTGPWREIMAYVRYPFGRIFMYIHHYRRLGFLLLRLVLLVPAKGGF
ncbi:hypothetical protein VTN00DRAFT_7344 [Thermoascus crustaceus]|uniref:uncharacterized protein n=1 Tax=Thermoascus crustaceus TaxID=5088 RepID=UPI003742159D